MIRVFGDPGAQYPDATDAGIYARHTYIYIVIVVYFVIPIVESVVARSELPLHLGGSPVASVLSGPKRSPKLGCFLGISMVVEPKLQKA